MVTYNRGHLWVFTFKEGLLSPIAHDLRLSLERFEVIVDGRKVKGTFWVETLNVDGAMKGDQLQTRTLNILERKQIKRTIRKEILDTKRFPTASFQGEIAEAKVVGDLTLKSQTQPVSIPMVAEHSPVSGRVELMPSQWGIAPYSALLGTLKLQDRLQIEFSLEAYP